MGLGGGRLVPPAFCGADSSPKFDLAARAAPRRSKAQAAQDGVQVSHAPVQRVRYGVGNQQPVAAGLFGPDEIIQPFQTVGRNSKAANGAKSPKRQGAVAGAGLRQGRQGAAGRGPVGRRQVGEGCEEIQRAGLD